MAPDSRTNVLIERYIETAKILSAGKQLEPMQLAVFQGETGLLIADMYDQLWTKENLREEVHAIIRAKCAECEQRRAALLPLATAAAAPDPVPATIKGQLFAALIANMGKLIICLTIILVAAIYYNRLAELSTFVNRTKIPSGEVTK